MVVHSRSIVDIQQPAFNKTLVKWYRCRWCINCLQSIYQPSGHGQITDIVDLISYRNPGGELSDIPIKLTQMMANNKARCDPRYIYIN